MTQFLAIINIINVLFPIVLQTIATVERAFPQAGQGPVKLELVRSVLEQAFTSLNTAEASFATVWPAMNAVIGGIVKLQKAVQPA